MNIINIIYLNNLELKTFIEQDVLDCCQLNSINLKNIIRLNLGNNQLTDISGIKLFKNLKLLYLHQNNELTDISALKDLINLEILYLRNCDVFNILYLKNLNKLKQLSLENTKITDISVIQYFKNLEWLSIQNLELESDQIQYIESLKKLNTLYSYKGFKNMNILNKLNININDK